jgi:hypothetical protein
LSFRFGDTEDTFGTGDVVYAPSGHTPGASEGSESVVVAVAARA